ncbi:hypothetical protein HYX08_03625 [Candidatus Woesearchaeota archaeon]|nr:hypothetical protein [Candidatus Woesearchaeota archaeon]
MTIATYTRAENRKSYIDNKVNKGRQAIHNSAILKEAMDNFNSLEKVDEVNNVFLNIASRAMDQPMLGHDNHWANAKIQELEEVLKFMNPGTWPADQKNYLYSRMRSNVVGQSSSVLSEMELLSSLKQKGLHLDINPSLANGKNPEVKIKIENREIFVEQTELSISETEIKLKEVFRQCCRWLHDKAQTNDIIDVQINSSKLVWTVEGPLDVHGSVNKIQQSIEKLGLWPFFQVKVTPGDFKHHFRLADLSNLSDPNKPLEEGVMIVEHYGEIGRYLKENLENETVKDFLHKNTSGDIIESPIYSFYTAPAKHGLVEMKTEESYPNLASMAQERNFIRRIMSKIKLKIAEGQRHSNCPNILAIKAENWITHGFTDESDTLLEELMFNPIKNSVNKIFETEKIENLSAVVLYEGDVRKGRVIINPYAKDQCKLLDQDMISIFS